MSDFAYTVASLCLCIALPSSVVYDHDHIQFCSVILSAHWFRKSKWFCTIFGLINLLIRNTVISEGPQGGTNICSCRYLLYRMLGLRCTSLRISWLHFTHLQWLPFRITLLSIYLALCYSEFCKPYHLCILLLVTGTLVILTIMQSAFRPSHLQTHELFIQFKASFHAQLAVQSLIIKELRSFNFQHNRKCVYVCFL